MNDPWVVLLFSRDEGTGVIYSGDSEALTQCCKPVAEEPG